MQAHTLPIQLKGSLQIDMLTPCTSFGGFVENLRNLQVVGAEGLYLQSWPKYLALTRIQFLQELLITPLTQLLRTAICFMFQDLQAMIKSLCSAKIQSQWTSVQVYTLWRREFSQCFTKQMGINARGNYFLGQIAESQSFYSALNRCQIHLLLRDRSLVISQKECGAMPFQKQENY
ncbi:hypothetical protein FGO68_gene6962 [Halteria grandinella]|uniref:Uncharacterized protein n=1 Tax=Halteria grandinella TaxID=5974 RepID=A0A8J8NPB4_HALGN|nr:hypothetical protein FGO68_gene6962 [Halteria grandinella]